MNRLATFGIVLAVLALGAFAARPAAAMNYHRIHSLSEPLNHTWTDELIHLDEDIKEANVAADTFSVTLNEDRPVPVQVEVLKGTPEEVKRVRLWLKITLPAGADELPIRITYNDQQKAASQPAGGAAVRIEKDRVALSTGVAEVLLQGTAAPKGDPEPLAKLPPILGARPAGAPAWYGRWQVRSDVPAAKVETTVVARGPVWAEVRLKYTFAAKGKAYELAVRGTAGEPWIDVRESYRLNEGDRLIATFRDRLKPAEALWLPWFVWEDGSVRPVNAVQRVSLAEKAGGGVFATLRPKWAQTRDSAQVCLAVGSGDNDPAVGLLMTSPADWQRPYEQFVQASVLAEGRGMAFEFPLAEGARHWALLAGSADRFDSEAELQALMRKNADIPLDRVLADWRFTWRRNEKDPAPHILTTWKRFQEIRAECQSGDDTPAARLIRQVLDGKTKGDQRLAEFLAGKRQDLGAGSVGAAIYLDRSYQDDFFTPTTYPRRLKRALQMADLAAAGRPAGDAQAALVGYIFTDLNYWPGYANGWDVGNPNFHTDMYGNALSAAAMMPDHPHARRWMKFAVDDLKDDLRRVVFMPGGAGYECPGYHAYALGHMLGMMQTIQNSGLGDPFQWPEVRSTIEFLRNLHTPPDPRLGRRSLAAIGDTHPWQEGAGALFGMVAAGFKETDPEFAAQCMAMYRHYYGEAGSGDLVQDVLQVDQSVPAADLKAMDWSSHAYPGFGAVLRSRFGTPGEAFATLKCGQARGHYQGDELSFHFFGAGMPLALDWHCGYQPRPDQEHMHNRVNLGDNENMDAVGKVIAFRTADAADLAVGEARSKRLRKMPRYAHEIVWQASYPRRTLADEAVYRRYLMLVKHTDGSGLEDYLVVRDELDSSEPATFNLFVLARTAEQNGREVRFDGQLAADAVLYFAAPNPEKVEFDRWSWPKQDSSSMIPPDFKIGADRWTKGELQQWVRVTAKPGEPFLAVLYPYRKGAAVPRFEPLDGGKGVRVTLGQETEDVLVASDPGEGVGGQAVVRRAGKTTVVLKAGEVPPLAQAPTRTSDLIYLDDLGGLVRP